MIRAAARAACACALAMALAPCFPLAAVHAAANPIVQENAQPGQSAAEWDVKGAGDPSLQGFSTEISVNRGETVHFKVRTDAPAYRIRLYRIGYYGGAGARLVAEIPASIISRFQQPECLSEIQTGLIDCGNWQVSASWAVPADAVSGVYIARLIRDDTGGASHIMFIVRNDLSRADILVQTSDTTWQAYNDYGGNSLYVGAPAERAYKVSYNRPMVLREKKYRRASFWANEYPTLRWLEANGYDVTYFSGVDTARRGELLRQHKVFMSVGHDEYWAAEQRAKVEAARDAGVHLAFLSGNAVFWKTRWEPSIDASASPWRTLVSYKETHADRKIDPSALATGTWRDPRFSVPTDGGRPENALKGSLFVANCCRFDAIVVSQLQGGNRFWRNTDVAKLQPGASVTVGSGIVGYEWDGDLDNGFRPAGLIRLSATQLNIDSALLDFGSNYGAGSVTHTLTLFKHASGSLVFSTGTILWGWALDATHDDPDARGVTVDPRLQQATVNILADMSVQPASPDKSLVLSPASQDETAPVATITGSPSLKAAIFHLPVTVSGSATDEGGVPAGVEISIDAGASWHPALGVDHWTYGFTPDRRGTVTILARAVDDSGNLQPVPTVATLRVAGYGLAVHVLLPWIAVATLIILMLMWALWRRRSHRVAGLRI